MATSSSKTLDHWRKVFREAGESDVFHVIRQAIRVAASNHPDEFRWRRDKIIEMLFAPLPCDEKDDEGPGNADVEAMEVKAIEEKEEESGFGNPVKSDGTLFVNVARTPLSAAQEPPPAAVAVVEEKAETKKQETWKVSSFENGKIRLRRVLLDQTKPSKPEDDGRGNAVKATEEKEEESGFGNPVKSDGTLFVAPTPLSAEQEPPPAAVAVVEEKAETKKQETWKVSVSENGKIRLRRVLLDQTKPSEPETTFTQNHPAPRNQEGSLPTFTDHHPAPRNQEGSLPTFTEHHPAPRNQEGSLPIFTEHHPEPRDDEEGSLRSNLEAAKRKLREGYQPFEPRPKKYCRRSLQFRISGARSR